MYVYCILSLYIYIIQVHAYIHNIHQHMTHEAIGSARILGSHTRDPEGSLADSYTQSILDGQQFKPKPQERAKACERPPINSLKCEAPKARKALQPQDFFQTYPGVDSTRTWGPTRVPNQSCSSQGQLRLQATAEVCRKPSMAIFSSGHILRQCKIQRQPQAKQSCL